MSNQAEAKEINGNKVDEALSHVAVGMFKDSTTGRWCTVTIQYNPTTNQVGTLNITNPVYDRVESEALFKTTVGKFVF